MSPLAVLFEDDDFIAVDKPPGLLSHASVDTARPDALRVLAAQLERDPGALHLLHRLDRDTSGVLLFAKTPEATRRGNEFFRAREAEKTYLGIARAQNRKRLEWTISNFLAEEKTAAGKAPRSVPVPAGGLPAVTHFRVLRQHDGFILVEARPETGRRHQIRSHLRESRLPLAGDTLYGGPAGTRVLLHAWRLAWPGAGGPVTVEAPVPADFPLRPA